MIGKPRPEVKERGEKEINAYKTKVDNKETVARWLQIKAPNTSQEQSNIK